MNGWANTERLFGLPNVSDVAERERREEIRGESLMEIERDDFVGVAEPGLRQPRQDIQPVAGVLSGVGGTQQPLPPTAGSNPAPGTKYFIEFFRDTARGFGVKCLGIMPVDKLPPGRKLGIEGREDLTIISDLTLQKGHREVTYKATPKRPLKVWTAYQVFQSGR